MFMNFMSPNSEYGKKTYFVNTKAACVSRPSDNKQRTAG